MFYGTDHSPHYTHIPALVDVRLKLARENICLADVNSTEYLRVHSYSRCKCLQLMMQLCTCHWHHKCSFKILLVSATLAVAYIILLVFCKIFIVLFYVHTNDLCMCFALKL